VNFRIGGTGISDELPQVCEHLAPILSHELAAGNEIQQVSTDAFERCRLFVILKAGFHAEHGQFAAGAGIKDGINRDPHYPVGRSFYCGVHQHALLAGGGEAELR
jgi:hypothetical protein